MSSPFRCDYCGVGWGGEKTCHCCRRTGGCGELFSTVRNFDAHRTGPVEDRRCLHPRSTRPRMVEVRPGVWGLPSTMPVPVAAVKISGPKTARGTSGIGRKKESQ